MFLPGRSVRQKPQATLYAAYPTGEEANRPKCTEAREYALVAVEEDQTKARLNVHCSLLAEHPIIPRKHRVTFRKRQR